MIIFSLVGFLIAYWLFTSFYPSFGGKVTVEDKKKYAQSANFFKGKFVNQANIPSGLSLGETIQAAYKFYTKKTRNARPSQALSIHSPDATNLREYDGDSRLIWYGHSTLLLQTDGMNLLLDPMFGTVPAPHPWLGVKRFSQGVIHEIDKLPPIDAVIISHDHYDHLDYESIKRLKDKVGHFFVPLGVGSHLQAWGIEKARITELDWWESIDFEHIKLTCTPAQHFSGRKFNTGQSTLWCSWVIKTKKDNLFFSGDSGYGEHFSRIGEQYGPFDLGLIECGQYDELWTNIHMLPEESAQAGMDVQANMIMPIHWAGFKLALHSWTDPIERVTQKSTELGLPIITPGIGEPVLLQTWKTYKKWW